jgi:hypothetical protein
MKKDKHITDVIFRVDTSKDFKGDVFALLPHECCDFDGHVTSYQHIGQHSGADYFHCIEISRPATEKEYESLKLEMESLGYNFKVIKRRSYDKYLKSYREIRKNI